MADKPFSMTFDPASPLVAAAIHAGHEVRDELVDRMAISEPDRLREEDPFTDRWTVVAGNRIVVHASRFEVDLNRPRDKAIYLRPEDAWGLQVWKTELPNALADNSLALYDAFYRKAEELFSELVRRHGYFLVLDLHSYNYRRNGPAGPREPAEANPEVNIGTGNLNRERWGPVVDGLMQDLSSFDYLGRGLDVRENVKFKGGYFSRWIEERFGGAGCAIAVEFKKFFMDEWTGRPDPSQLEAVKAALLASIPGLLKNRPLVAKFD